MTTRSRLQDYIRLRVEHFGCRERHMPSSMIRPSQYGLLTSDEPDSSDRHPLQTQHVTSSSDDHAIEMQTDGMGSGLDTPHNDPTLRSLPKPWSDIISDVNDILQEIENKMKSLNELQKKHLTCQFGFGHDEETEEHEIDVETRSIARTFKELEQFLHHLENLVKADQRVGFDAQRRLVLNLKLKLVGSANTLSRNFRSSQRVYLQRMSRMKQKRSRFQAFSLAGLNNKDRIIDELDREEVVERYLDQGFTQEQVEMMIVQEKATKERDEEIQRILHSITDLHDMFRDVNIMVIEQGTILDQIDHNLSLARDRVTAGVKELTKANEYQGQAKWKLIFLLITVLILLLSLIMIGKFAMRVL